MAVGHFSAWSGPTRAKPNLNLRRTGYPRGAIAPVVGTQRILFMQKEQTRLHDRTQVCHGTFHVRSDRRVFCYSRCAQLILLHALLDRVDSFFCHVLDALLGGVLGRVLHFLRGVLCHLLRLIHQCIMCLAQ